MLGIISLIFFGLSSAITANKKGFKCLRWFFSLGFIGLIVLGNLPSAKQEGLSLEEAAARTERGNRIGANLAIATLCLNVVFAVVSLSIR